VGYHFKIHKNTLSTPIAPAIKPHRVFIIFRSVVTIPIRFLEKYGCCDSTYILTVCLFLFIKGGFRGG